MPWRENGEEKRDRTDTWVHERKHYVRHLDKLDSEERSEGTRSYREKYFRGVSPSAKGIHGLPGYKNREEDYYRKPTKQKSDKYSKQTLDTAPKCKRKEEARLKEHKHSHCEDPTREEKLEQKPNKVPDKQKQSDKEKFKDSDKKSEEEVPDEAERVNVKTGTGTENEVISDLSYYWKIL